MKERRKEGTWGFCRNKKEIHVWVDKKVASKRSIVRLLAHEIGHKQRPFHRLSSKEEDKAESYAAVALTAYDIMEHLVEGKTGNVYDSDFKELL